MTLSEPKQTTFWVAVILFVLGFLGELITIPFISGIAFWLVVLAFVVLAAGNLMKGF